MLPEKQRFATLDGLRGVAAMFVVALHALDPLDLGFVVAHARLAVDFFFLLSGFVIAHAYQKRLESGFSFFDFLRVRAIRLYPLFLLGNLCGVVVFSGAGHPTTPANAVLALVCAIFVVPSPVKLAQGWDTAFPYNVPSWSLFFEILINLIYAVLAKRLTRRMLTAILAISGASWLVLDYLRGGISGGSDWNELYVGLIRVVFPFFCGVALYRLRFAAPVRRRPVTLALVILLAAILAFPKTRFDWIFCALLVLLLFPGLVVWGAADQPPAWIKPGFLFAGRFSYPLYIIHYPIRRIFTSFLRTHHFQGYALCLGIAAEVTCVTACAYVAAVYFDEPVRAILGNWLKSSGQASKASPLEAVAHPATRP